MQLLQLQLPKILMLFINANETRGEEKKDKKKKERNPRNVAFHLRQWRKSVIVSESELFLHVADNP